MRNIVTCQGDDHKLSLLDYPYFKEIHKLFAIDPSKQQVLNADLSDTEN